MPTEPTAPAESPRLTRFRALAEELQVDFFDLIEEPPDPALVGIPDVQHMLDHLWVPRSVHVVGSPAGGASHTIVKIATALPPSDTVKAEIAAWFDADLVAVTITTDWDIEHCLLDLRADSVVHDASTSLALKRPDLSAHVGWRPWQRNTAIVSALVCLACVVVWPKSSVVAAIVASNVMFFVGAAFRSVLGVIGMVRVHRHRASKSPAPDTPDTDRIPDEDLPVYTILVPAFREASVIAKIMEHIAALDYPSSKLQVLLLLEQDDHETIEAARAARPPEWIRFVIVPPGGPQTKPKACNVGLAVAKGEFLVIFDAEDRPEADQLRSIVAQFRRAEPTVACIQARLNYFNDRENVLTRLFTLEYSHWFDYMLPGLDAVGLPIPLGGTSNHFRTSMLRELGGWDPHNVTEDADLGMRADAFGYRVGVSSSTTWEEACSHVRPWIRQRTRWIKGYMVTVLVNTRSPGQLARPSGWRRAVSVIGLLAGTPAMFLAAPAMWGMWLFTFLGGSLESLDLPTWMTTPMIVNFIGGNILLAVSLGVAAWRRRKEHLIGFALLAPVYWILHSVAAWRAFLHLLRRPGHWEKTPHGIQHGPAPATT